MNKEALKKHACTAASTFQQATSSTHARRREDGSTGFHL
jgi:hypothetical protein